MEKMEIFLRYFASLGDVLLSVRQICRRRTKKWLLNESRTWELSSIISSVIKSFSLWLNKVSLTLCILIQLKEVEQISNSLYVAMVVFALNIPFSSSWPHYRSPWSRALACLTFIGSPTPSSYGYPGTRISPSTTTTSGNNSIDFLK